MQTGVANKMQTTSSVGKREDILFKQGMMVMMSYSELYHIHHQISQGWRRLWFANWLCITKPYIACIVIQTQRLQIIHPQKSERALSLKRI